MNKFNYYKLGGNERVLGENITNQGFEKLRLHQELFSRIAQPLRKEADGSKITNDNTLLPQKVKKKLKRKANKEMKLLALKEMKVLNLFERKRKLSHCDKKEEKDEKEEPPFKIKKDRTPEELEYIKALRERSKKVKQLPEVFLKRLGESADLKKDKTERKPLLFTTIQYFILRSQLGLLAPGSKEQNAIGVKAAENLKKRIFILVEGISLKDYVSHEENLISFPSFSIKAEFISPHSYGGDLIEELVSVPLSGEQKKKFFKKYGSLNSATNLSKGVVFQAFKKSFKLIEKCEEERNVPKFVNVTDKFPRTALLLNPWQMVMEGYPTPGAGSYSNKFAGFVPTKDYYLEVTPNSPMWAVDCEMCMTKAGSELTKIAIIDEKLQVVYETLVKPYNRITNYLTQFSGITESMLEGVWTRLEDVQSFIQRNCPPDVILVGHSLNGDLVAMKMFHPYVIDTSVCYNMSGERFRKSRLKHLAAEYLSERIQCHGADGHDPTEDASSAMKLALLKLQHSFEWGDAVLSGPRDPTEALVAQTLLLERDKKAEACGMLPPTDIADLFGPSKASASFTMRSNHDYFASMFNYLIKYDKTVNVLGREEVMQEYENNLPMDIKRVTISKTRTNKEAVKEVRKSKADFLLVHIRFKRDRAFSALKKLDKWVGALIQKSGITPILFSIFLSGSLGSNESGLCLARVKNPVIPDLEMPRSLSLSTQETKPESKIT